MRIAYSGTLAVVCCTIGGWGLGCTPQSSDRLATTSVAASGPGSATALSLAGAPQFELAFAGLIPEFGADTAIAATRPNVIAGMVGAMLQDSIAAIGNYDHVLVHNFESRTSRVIGRRGEGPGEFGRISYIYRTADGFAVADNNADRILLFGGGGEYLSTVTYTGGGSIGWLHGVGPVARRGGITTPNVYTSFDSTGSTVRDLLLLPPFPDLTAVVTHEDGGTGHLTMGWPCDPPLLHAVIGSTLYVVDQKSASVIAADASGQSRSVFRRPVKGRVTNAMHNKIRNAYMRAEPADVGKLLQRFGAPGDSLYVTWDWMVADPNGGIWLRYSSCLNEGERLWDWIDTSGTYRGSLRSNRHMIAAFGNYILVRGEDSTGVPEVSRWKVVPAAPKR